jgi:hypothetical protein
MFIFLFCFMAFHTTASARDFEIYGKGEQFTWKEFDEDGSRLLKESGRIYGIGISTKYIFRNNLTIRARAEIFGGTVDYDGQACNNITGSCSPTTTDTSYVGSKIEGDFGLRIVSTEKFFLEPFAGIGSRYWERDIKSTSHATGYLEKWRTVYTRLGLNSELRITSVWDIFAEWGVRLPLHTENRVDVLGLTLEPGNSTSFFAEIGTRISMLKLVAFYEGMRFSKSPVKYRYYQPKSEADMYGINIGLEF